MRRAARDRQAATDCGGWRDRHNGGSSYPPLGYRCSALGFEPRHLCRAAIEVQRQRRRADREW